MRSAPAIRWLLVAFGALVLAAVLAPSAVPIYDGIGNPDEPYRYVEPPANARTTRPPAPVTSTLKVTNGQTASAQINTDEYGPQLALFVPSGAFAPPEGASKVTVTAAPVLPPRALPADGTIEGNVYRVTATAPGGTVDLIGLGDQAPVLDMRSPTASQPGPVFEHYDNGEWTSYQTSRIGNDIYRTRMSALGFWALVRRPGHGGGSQNLFLAIVAGVLGAGGVAVGLLAVRRRRARGTTDESPVAELSR
jgi:hypothetical protein